VIDPFLCIRACDPTLGTYNVNFRRTNAALGIEIYLPYEVVTSHVTPRMILVQGHRVLVKV
jgi:hypothetical protein